MYAISTLYIGLCNLLLKTASVFTAGSGTHLYIPYTVLTTVPDVPYVLLLWLHANGSVLCSYWDCVRRAVQPGEEASL